MDYKNTIKEVQEMAEILEAVTDVINNNHLLDCEKIHTIKVILGQEEEETPEINYAVFPVQDVDVTDGFYADIYTFDEIDDILSLLLNTDFDIEE